METLLEAFVADPFQPGFDLQPAVFAAWTRGVTAPELCNDLHAQLVQLFNLTTSSTGINTGAGGRSHGRRVAGAGVDRPRVSVSSSSSSSSDSEAHAASPPTASPRASQRHANDSSDSEDENAAAIVNTNQSTTNTNIHAKKPAKITNTATSRFDSQSLSLSYGRLVAAAQASIVTQYRIYSLLEPSLKKPSLFLINNVSLFQLSASDIETLCEFYYSFDLLLFRELMGAKVKKISRSEIEVIGGRVGVRISSAIRQWENLRRIYRHRWPDSDSGSNDSGIDEESLASLTLNGNVSLRFRTMIGTIRSNTAAVLGNANANTDTVSDSVPTPLLTGSSDSDPANIFSSTLTYHHIASYYRIPLSLARQYLHIIFLCHYRITTVGKRLSGVKFAEMERIAGVLMREWCATASQAMANSSNNTTGLTSPSTHTSMTPRRQSQSNLFTIGSNALFDRQISSSVGSGSLVMNSPPPMLNRLHSSAFLPLSHPSPSSHIAATAITLASSPFTIASTNIDSGSGDVNDAVLTDVLDSDFIADLKVVKVYISEQKRLTDDYLTAVLQTLKVANPALRLDRLRPRVPTVLKPLLLIAATLHKNKKIRSLLVDLAEQVCKPLYKNGVTAAEFAEIVGGIQAGFLSLPDVNARLSQPLSQPQSVTVGVSVDDVSKCYWSWARFLRAVVPISCILYQAMEK